MAQSKPKQQVDPANDLIKEMRKNLQKDRKMLEQYFNGNFLDRVDGFFKDSGHMLDHDPEYQRMLEEFKKSFQGMGSGIRTEWRETKEGKIYVIHAALAENDKFDLKIKGERVSVSGSLKKSLGSYGNRSMSFKKSFPVPRNVDASLVQVKAGEKLKGSNSKDEIWLVFPWKKGKAPKTRPVKKSPGDKTI